MHVSFIELEAFTREVLLIADEEALRQFQNELAANPESGDLIRASGGLRKARFKLVGRGRSSGARRIYLWLPNRGLIVLFMLYAKARQAEVPPPILRLLREAVEKIKSRDKP